MQLRFGGGCIFDFRGCSSPFRGCSFLSVAPPSKPQKITLALIKRRSGFFLMQFAYDGYCRCAKHYCNTQCAFTSVFEFLRLFVAAGLTTFVLVSLWQCAMAFIIAFIIHFICPKQPLHSTLQAILPQADQSDKYHDKITTSRIPQNISSYIQQKSHSNECFPVLHSESEKR